MKKIAIAIAIMLAFSAFAMAGEVVVSGDATTTFGYNLDASTYGLVSDVSSSVSMTVGEADAESMGEGDWYGVIELTGASIAWDSTADEALGYEQYEWNSDTEAWDSVGVVPELFVVTTPDVMAKITDGNLYAMLQSEAGFAADYVAGVGNTDAMEFGAPAVAGSWTLGGVFGPATVAVELATAGSYEDAAQVDGVALGTTVGLDLAPLMVDFAFAGGFGYAADQDMGFALQVAADVAPLTVTAAFDGISGAVFTYEAGLGVDADLAPLSVGADLYYAENDVDTAVSVGYADDAMGVDLAVGADDLTTTLVWNVALDLTYAVNSGVALAAGFSMDSADMMAAYANVALTEVIDNVTFTLGWEEANDLQGVDATETDLGQVIFATSLAY